MESVHKLPKNYQLQIQFDMVKDKQVIALAKRIVSLVYLTVSGALFVYLLVASIQFLYWGIKLDDLSILDWLLILFSGMFAGFGLMGYIHKAIEGNVIWHITGQKLPSRAGKPYVYIDMPNWYFSRNQYLLIILTPVTTITAVCLTMIPLVSIVPLILLLFVIVINLAGSIIKLIIAGYLLTQPSEAFVQNTGMVISVYMPEETVAPPTKPSPILVEKQPNEKAIADKPIFNDWFDIPLLKKSEQHLFLTKIEDEQTP